METKQQSNATSVQIFNNSQFGQMRTLTGTSGEPLFCLADVCKSLDLEQVFLQQTAMDVWINTQQKLCWQNYI